jgi:NAD(P)-dependent dehydrogenase (short-subunit alcohol dehydrogenase family)
MLFNRNGSWSGNSSTSKAVATALILASGAALAASMFKRPHYSFRNRVVVITGGTRGLGLVMARMLAAEGARLVICSRTVEQLERAEAELRSRGAEVLALNCDVSHQDEVQRLVDATMQRWGQIDVVFNVAGVIQVGPLEEMTLEDFREAMDIHFWGPVYMSLAVLPHMRQRGAGRIVNISSIGGRISVPHLVPYSASKFALIGFSEGLRAEAAKDGIVVTTISPGMMRTGSPYNALFKGQHRAEQTWFTLGASLPVVSMSAEAAASQVIEACRNGSSSITLSVPAKLADMFHGVFPGITSDILALVNRLLPSPGGIGKARARGQESQSAFSPSVLTTLTDRAAARNNELP